MKLNKTLKIMKMIKIVANHEMIKIVTKYEDGQNIVTIMNSLATPTEEPTSSPGSDCTDIFSKESEEVRLEDDHDNNDDVDDDEERLEDDHDNNDDVDIFWKAQGVAVRPRRLFFLSYGYKITCTSYPIQCVLDISVPEMPSIGATLLILLLFCI